MSKRIFYLSEEFADYMGFLPYEVKTEVEDRFGKFENAEETKVNEYGPFSITLLQRKIPFDDISKMINSALPRYDEVRFEMFPEETLDGYFAFGDDDFFIFGGKYEDNPHIVEWMECYLSYKPLERAKMEIVVQLFYLIGSKYRLFLSDFRHKKVIELDSKEKIALYLINTFTTA